MEAIEIEEATDIELKNDQPIKQNVIETEDIPEKSRCFNCWDFLIFGINWVQVIYHISLIAAFVYSSTTSVYFVFYKYFLKYESFPRVCSWTFAITTAILSGVGLSAGCHRLWSHHAYKAKLPTRLLFAFLFTLSAESTIYTYVKHHRAHHIYLDTNADPQSIKRGFWFAQLGWRLLKPRSEYREKVASMVFDDVLNDPVVKYQKVFFIPLIMVFAFIVPTLIPYYLWKETLLDSFLICALSKSWMVITFHGLLGSVSHWFGQRPYNNKISATDNRWISLFSAGEGYHNFHHQFPYDYSISEFGYVFNLSKLFIDTLSLFGQTYDMRLAGTEYVEKAKNKVLMDDDLNNNVSDGCESLHL